MEKTRKKVVGWVKSPQNQPAVNMPTKRKSAGPGSSKKKTAPSTRDLIASSAVHRIATVHSVRRITEPAVAFIQELYRDLFEDLSRKAAIIASRAKRSTIKPRDVAYAIEMMENRGLRKILMFDAVDKKGKKAKEAQNSVFVIHKDLSRKVPPQMHALYTAQAPLQRKMKEIAASEGIHAAGELAVSLAQAAVEARIGDILFTASSAAHTIAGRITVGIKDLEFVDRGACTARGGGL
jgi:histone H3/H4